MSSAPVITPQNSESKRGVRGATSSNGKENMGNSRPTSASGAPKLSSAARAEARALRTQKSAATSTILEEQKSVEALGEEATDLVQGKRLSDAMDAEAEPPLTSCPIALALRGSERDYCRIEGLLETKLSSGKAVSINHMREQLEKQKSVIIELRGVGKELLTRCLDAEKVAVEFTSQHEAASAKLEEELGTTRTELASASDSVAALTQEKQNVETRLNSALASFAAVDEQRRVILEERDAARAELAVKSMAEEACRKQLDESAQELVNCKAESEAQRTASEQRQMAADKEMNEMRESLGREMVAAREATSKLTIASSELAELKTKVAVLEESLKMSKQETQRLEAERTAKAQDLQALERDKAALGVRVEEMQRRLDEREAQHTEAFKSIAAGQEMQVFVCVLCVCARALTLL
jgi:hypothetical protein